MTLDATTIEAGLQERWEQYGHDISYLTMRDRDGSTLHCTRCLLQVELEVNSLGGWWIDKQHLDKPCQGGT